MFDLEKFKAGALAVDRRGNKWEYVHPHNHYYPLTTYDIVARRGAADHLSAFLRSGHFWHDKRFSAFDLVSMDPVESSASAPAPAADKQPMWRSVVALTLVCLAASEVLDRKGYDMDSPEFMDLLADKFKANESVHEEARLAMGGVVATLGHFGAQNMLASLGFLHKRSMNA